MSAPIGPQGKPKAPQGGLDFAEQLAAISGELDNIKKELILKNIAVENLDLKNLNLEAELGEIKNNLIAAKEEYLKKEDQYKEQIATAEKQATQYGEALQESDQAYDDLREGIKVALPSLEGKLATANATIAEKTELYNKDTAALKKANELLAIQTGETIIVANAAEQSYVAEKAKYESRIQDLQREIDESKLFMADQDKLTTEIKASQGEIVILNAKIKDLEARTAQAPAVPTPVPATNPVLDLLAAAKTNTVTKEAYLALSPQQKIDLRDAIHTSDLTPKQSLYLKKVME